MHTNPQTKHKFYAILLLLNLGVLKILDVISTKLALTIPNTIEGNPIVARLIEYTNINIGLCFFLIVNIVVIYLAINCIYKINNPKSLKIIIYVTILISIVSMIAIINNLNIFFTGGNIIC